MRPLLGQSLASLSAAAKGVTVHSRHAVSRTRKLRHCCSPLSARFSHRNLCIQRKTAWQGPGKGCVVAETTREKRDREQRQKMEEELKDVVVPQFRDVGLGEESPGTSAAPASSATPGNRPAQGASLRFKVISFNVLAQVYVRSSLFPHSHNVALRWKRRSKAMALLLSSIGADFLLLQEVDQYEDFYKPIMEANGYGSVYKLRTGHKKDGSAIFFRRERFELLACRDIEFNDLAPPMTDAEAAEAAEAAATGGAMGGAESDREALEDSVRARGEANGKGGRGASANNNGDRSDTNKNDFSNNINNNNNNNNNGSASSSSVSSAVSSRQPSSHDGTPYLPAAPPKVAVSPRADGGSSVTAASGSGNSLALGLKRAGAASQLAQARGAPQGGGDKRPPEAETSGAGWGAVVGTIVGTVEPTAGAMPGMMSASGGLTSVAVDGAVSSGGGGSGGVGGGGTTAPAATVVVSAKVEANNSKKQFYNHPRLRWIRDDVAVMAKFVSREDPSRVLVLSSSHLFWDPLLDDVKLAQARLLVDRVAQFRDEPTPVTAPIPAPATSTVAGEPMAMTAQSTSAGAGPASAGSGPMPGSSAAAPSPAVPAATARPVATSVGGRGAVGQGVGGRAVSSPLGTSREGAGGASGADIIERFEEASGAPAAAIRHPLPVIIGGDFNSKPDSKVYHFLASASESLDKQCTANYDSYVAQADATGTACDPQGGAELFPCACLGLESAYGGAEPQFTTYCPDFTGTIDYIWHTGAGTGLQVTQRLQLPVRGEKSLDVGLPNYSHPSDHLPIGAEFELS
eukprot:jgi/Mesvir1/7559/Mv19300-RA.1